MHRANITTDAVAIASMINTCRRDSIFLKSPLWFGGVFIGIVPIFFLKAYTHGTKLSIDRFVKYM